MDFEISHFISDDLSNWDYMCSSAHLSVKVVPRGMHANETSKSLLKHFEL